MRLGELLVADGRLTDEQVEQGLRAQVLWGGRLGTNLVELGLIDLDELSWALARLHRVPVALARHFARPDLALQERLGAALAEKWQCVPLARLAEDPPRIGIAAIAPLPPDAIEEISAQLGEATEAIVVAVAAEMRILYHLELSYGLGRPARYMRARDTAPPEAPEPVTGESSEVEIELPPPPAAEDLTPISTEPAVLPLAAPVAGEEEGDVSTGPEHRRYMPMVGEEERRVGRIAIRKVAVYAEDGVVTPGTWPEALRAIRRAHDRDRVGELAVSALTSFCPGLQVAAVLVVRGPVVIGWRGRNRDGVIDLRAIAVPLDQPSGLAEAVASGSEVERRLQEGGADLDHRLALALGALGPAQARFSPISLSEGRVACVLYCQLELEAAAQDDVPAAGDPRAAGTTSEAGLVSAVAVGPQDGSAGSQVTEQIANVVASMRSAFLRLIRAASR